VQVDRLGCAPGLVAADEKSPAGAERNVTMSGWIKIIVEFIKELAGQWKGSSDPNVPQ
jgi:hypothetical protein